MGARHDQDRPVIKKFSFRECEAQAGGEIAGEPQVGIFWLYDGRLLIDATPLSQAASYGEFKIHDGGHYVFWPMLQRARLVPENLEYDEVPRGRVAYNTKERRFHLLADACIQKNERMMDGIKCNLHLPANTFVRADLHYKCPGCMKVRDEHLEDEEGTGHF